MRLSNKLNIDSMIKRLRRFFITLRAHVRLWVATAKADRAYADAELKNSKDKRFYVMPDADDKLIIMNRSQFRKLKQYKYMDGDVQVKHLIKESFYFTPYSGGANAMTSEQKRLKRVMYVRYCLHKAKLL